ncbi:MAG: DUF2085 domain-containing protein, partial [Acidobacteria bacterium]|nr:DUF2085 domain-containing protein [Acidobacteriota bacterium]
MPSLISEYVPQLAAGEGAARRRRRAGTVAWGAACAFALLVLGLVVLAPALRAEGSFIASQVVYRLFSAACHQMPERSFHLLGFPLAVCARCAGLYAGAAAGLLAYPLLRRPLARIDAPPRGWLLLAALPTSVDFALGVLGVWENTHASRFSTALVLGAASAFFVMPGLADLASRNFRQF